MARQPLLSVVITSYTMKRLAGIYELLESIKAQTCTGIEIIFVAESRELYEKVSTHCAGNGINAMLIFSDSRSGLSATRNLGASQATGDIIAFVDDDALPFPGWASHLVKTYDDDSVIGVTGAAFPLWDGEPQEWFPEELYWIIGCTAWSDNERREVRNAWGMNMSFRREALQKAGLFTEEFGLHDNRRTGWADPPSEDVDLSLRVRQITGKRIIFNPDAGVRHRVSREKLSLKFITRRAYSVGYQRRMLKRLYPGASLGQEQRLLKRILIRLLPGTLAGFFTRPADSWRRLTITVTALFFVTAGYYSRLIKPFSKGSHVMSNNKTTGAAPTARSRLR